MPRSGGIVGSIRGDARIVAEFRRWVARGVPVNERLGLPEDQVALVSLAASKVSPTILERIGVEQTEENRGVVEGWLLVVWANALLTLDPETLDRIKTEVREARRSGTSPT